MAARVNGNVSLNYEEADSEKWQAAMQNEFKSLVENKNMESCGFTWWKTINERQMDL